MLTVQLINYVDPFIGGNWNNAFYNNYFIVFMFFYNP